MFIRSITFALISKQSVFDYKILASYLLPKGILEFFDVTAVNEDHTESRQVNDFPIRDHKVVLHVRRLRWLTAEGRNIILDRYSLLADNTSYSKEFADVLKKIFGYLPDNGPLAGAIL